MALFPLFASHRYRPVSMSRQRLLNKMIVANHYPKNTHQKIMRMSTKSATTSNIQKQLTFCGLDLRYAGLSVMERLCLEECLLRHDTRQWMIWGTHGHPVKCSRYLNIPNTQLPSYLRTGNNYDNNNNNNNNNNMDDDPCIVVMGIGGKPELLLDIPKVKEHGVWVIKRFSGGGTVVVDQNCLYTTIIGRNDQLAHIPPYPRNIMEWTATDVFGPLFDKLQQKAIQKNSYSNHQKYEFPDFELKENDYVLGTTQKVAGNAQSIVKTGFLHHTTFLWEYKQDNMQYLTLPAKRPEYRKDRSHSSFLIQLKDAYHNQLDRSDFFDSLQEVCQESFDMQLVSLEEVLDIVSSVVGDERGIQAFFETKGRTRLVDLP